MNVITQNLEIESNIDKLDTKKKNEYNYNVMITEKDRKVIRRHLAFFPIPLDSIKLTHIDRVNYRKLYFIPKNVFVRQDNRSYMPLVYALLLLRYARKYKNTEIKIKMPESKREEFYKTLEVVFRVMGDVRMFREFQRTYKKAERNVLEKIAYKFIFYAIEDIDKLDIGEYAYKKYISVEDRKIKVVFYNKEMVRVKVEDKEE